MDIHKLKNIYFLGIGGIGMSALARYFHAANIWVSGYDKTPSGITKSLEKEGIKVYYEARPDHIPQDCDLVIYTPAVPTDFEEWSEIHRRKIPFVKRSEALAMLCNEKKTIGVAGTHGKTTVTAMIAHILKENDFPVNAFVGGIMTEYNTNIFIDANADWVLVEADEYDRSFLRLFPDIAIINAIDADHLDIYKNIFDLEQSFYQFTRQCKNPAALIFNESIKPDSFQFPDSAISFSARNNAAFEAKNIKVENGRFTFDVIKLGEEFMHKAVMPIPGRHNIENALAAIIAADKLGLSSDEIRNALSCFKGVKRRFDKICECNGKIYYDDYAHHPKEIKALILAIRELHPDKKVCGVFQPHLFSRTNDFADDFAQNLALLDRAVVTDIYPAREEPIQGIDAHFLLDKIHGCQKEYIAYDKIPDEVCKKQEDILLTIGAGDIDRLVPKIKAILTGCK